MKIILGVVYAGFLAVFIWSTALYFQDVPVAVHIGIDREEFIDVTTFLRLYRVVRNIQKP